MIIKCDTVVRHLGDSRIKVFPRYFAIRQIFYSRPELVVLFISEYLDRPKKIYCPPNSYNFLIGVRHKS
jgi:hypothetical protein